MSEQYSRALLQRVVSMLRNVGHHLYDEQKECQIYFLSKNLKKFAGNYANITKLDAVSSRFLLDQLNQMISEEMYNLFYEDALVQMIFQKNFELYYKDIKDYKWTEVDCVDDLLKARQIQEESKK